VIEIIMKITLEKIKVKDKEINYNLKRSRKARKMRLTIYCDGSLVATVPHRFSSKALEQFIVEKSQWIFKKIDYFENSIHRGLWKNNPGDFKKYKNEAQMLVEKKVQHFNQIYGFNLRKISIRNQKTRWGSCSRRGNLSFNYKIVFLPEHLADYIIVHEICHLSQFNHSLRFWQLVEKTIEDYKILKREVRKL
jgi:predicted metal-dependent hydrolase